MGEFVDSVADPFKAREGFLLNTDRQEVIVTLTDISHQRLLLASNHLTSNWKLSMRAKACRILEDTVVANM